MRQAKIPLFYRFVHSFWERFVTTRHVNDIDVLIANEMGSVEVS